MKNSQAPRQPNSPPPRFPSSRVFTTFNGNAPLWSFPLPFHARPRLLPFRGKYLSLSLPLSLFCPFCPSIDEETPPSPLPPSPPSSRSNNYFEQSVSRSSLSLAFDAPRHRPFFYALNNPATMRRINLACPKAYYLTYIRDVHPSRGSTFNPLSRWGGLRFLGGTTRLSRQGSRNGRKTRPLGARNGVQSREV